MDTIQIFVLLIHITFQDGASDMFWPAFRSQEECQHFAEHMVDYAQLTNATLENDLVCTPAILTAKPALSNRDKDV